MQDMLAPLNTTSEGTSNDTTPFDGGRLLVPLQVPSTGPQNHYSPCHKDPKRRTPNFRKLPFEPSDFWSFGGFWAQDAVFLCMDSTEIRGFELYMDITAQPAF